VLESLVVNLGHRPSSTFGKNFYRLPFTPPPLPRSDRLIGPSPATTLPLPVLVRRPAMTLQLSVPLLQPPVSAVSRGVVHLVIVIYQSRQGPEVLVEVEPQRVVV
jgi:hypothetical protein